MGANERPADRFQSEGQSVLEFLLMLPMLIGMTMILLKVNTAIQISIVDQQYARAQAFFLTFNSPFYPKTAVQSSLISTSTNQMMIGVSDNQSKPGYTPTATVQFIARTKNIQGDNSPKAEPKRRSNVRVRNTVTLCTQNYFMKNAQGQNVGIFDGTTYALNESTSQGLFSNICVGTNGYE